MTAPDTTILTAELGMTETQANAVLAFEDAYRHQVTIAKSSNRFNYDYLRAVQASISAAQHAVEVLTGWGDQYYDGGSYLVEAAVLIEEDESD